MGSREVEKVAPRLPELRPRPNISPVKSQGTTLRLQVLAAEEMPEGELQVQCGGECREPHRHCEGPARSTKSGGHMACLGTVPKDEGVRAWTM